MGSILAHRGPDDSGMAVCGPCGLVHRRLSIIDLSRAGRQPLPNEDGSLQLACNGEIYNFMELRSGAALDGRGHVFRSRTDSEVLVHLFEEQGEAMLPSLDGMFALALWDSRRSRLLLARDRYGIKPLFFARVPGGMVFASEIKAILRSGLVTPEPDRTALHHYMSLDYIPGSLTAFRGISELPPGCAMEVSDTGETREWRFFEPSYRIDRDMSEEEAVEGSLAMLGRAVEKQLVSDVPVGVMLSGGMDSSSLSALMARTLGSADFHTFSLGFDDPSFDESRFARQVAAFLGTEHHEIRVTSADVSRLLPRYLAYIDEPYGDGSAIPTFMLARQAGDFVTVLLSGEGGDEFFGGYDTHAAHKVRRVYRKLPRILRRGVVSPIVEALPVSHRKLSFEFKAKRFARGAELPVARSHYSWREVLDEERKTLVLAGDPAGMPATCGLFEEAYAGCSAEDELNRLLRIDWAFHLADDLMIKNDRMTMASSLEARVPFTDNELVNFLSTVPVEHKLPGLRKKNLLRKAMKGLLPDAILDKKKVGLEMPYSSWLRGDLREFAGSVLSGPKLAETGLFRPEGVEDLWSQHQLMRMDNGRALWGILNYMIWHGLYISGNGWVDVLESDRVGGPVA